MTAHPSRDLRGVALEEAGAEDVVVLRRLMQLYLYDLGTVDGWDIGADGLYGNGRRIERFWTEAGRRSFLIRVGGILAGFALTRDSAAFAGAGTREVSEFFVLRKYRRQDVGRRAATRLFDMFHGPWEVTELASNVDAQAFWRAVIASYTDGRFMDTEEAHDDWRGRVQRFTAPGSTKA